MLFVFGLLYIFNTKLSGIGTALGVAGAGIAFDLQEVIVSIAGYVTNFPFLWVEITRPIKTARNYEYAKETFTQILEQEEELKQFCLIKY